MEYIKQNITFKIEEPTVLSLGKFDGLHRGHELLMGYMAEKKKGLPGLKAVVFTFDVPPRGRCRTYSSRCLPQMRRRSGCLKALG